ncbi:hypothetical protein Bca52824_029949 [Brassica carinata]|uniref:Uncharacterized protein n=1 Tax=Brassica carinata TaxID=52824 RepID=A0A8X7S5B8_BRACI|nr:hypothetical protein Bca52824_029949 [Brassica carinata]
MARHKSNAPPKVTRHHQQQPRSKQQSSGAERSALYARREAAKSSTPFSEATPSAEPSLRSNHSSSALPCATNAAPSLSSARRSSDVLEIANVLNSKWKAQTISRDPQQPRDFFQEGPGSQRVSNQGRRTEVLKDRLQPESLAQPRWL